MDDPERQQAFEQRVRQTLEEGEAQLDADTLHALRRARNRALSELASKRPAWQPLGLAALAAGIAIVVSLQLMLPTQTASVPTVEDLAVISAGDDFDLYENLEFYQWLELEQHNG